MITAWLAAFALTQLVEVPIYTWALGDGARRLPTRVALAFAASCPTHPFVFLVLPRLWPGSYAGYVAAAEAVAVLVEAAWLRHLRVGRPLGISVLANGASTLVGWACRAALGWP